MRRAAIGLVAGAMLLAGSTTTFAQSPGASADVKLPNGDAVGMATFTEESGGVRLKGQFKGLPPGPHGIHIHEVGKCDAPDFTTAGGHYNPTSRQHGLNNPQGAHGGDMPNLTVAADGSGSIDFLLEDVNLGSGSGSLLKTDGTALVIHANADDEMTDPSGNSGGRIACGVIARAGTAQAAPAAQPSPAAKPAASPAAASAAPAAKPAAAASPAAKPAPAQAPAAVASPSALPRTGTAALPIDASLPAAVAGLSAMVTGLAIWRRRK